MGGISSWRMMFWSIIWRRYFEGGEARHFEEREAREESIWLEARRLCLSCP